MLDVQNGWEARSREGPPYFVGHFKAFKLSTTDQHSVYETYFQQIETSLQLEGLGTALRAEGILFILNWK